MGKANTLEGAQGSPETSSESTTQSCPQEKTFSALLESKGSWCMPAP